MSIIHHYFKIYYPFAVGTTYILIIKFCFIFWTTFINTTIFKYLIFYCEFIFVVHIVVISKISDQS
jgi:hypothetical protein